MPVCNVPAATESANGPGSVAALVVQNGRYAGTRRALGSAITVIGRDSGCDIRLDAQGVSPIHCIIATVGTSLRLRTLPDTFAVIVNGAPVFDCVLANGDLLE